MSLIALLFIIEITFAACPNGCSGHGTCTNEGTCDCFKSVGLGVNERNVDLPSFTEPDCSLRTCPQGESFAAISSTAYTESGVLIRSGRELSEEECSLDNSIVEGAEVINVNIDNPSSNRFDFGGTLRCGEESNINAYTCDIDEKKGGCCLVEKKVSENDATETEAETGTPTDNVKQCSFTFQNFDLSLVYALSFVEPTDKKGNNSATIKDSKALFEHYDFETDYDYRFACITDTTTKVVELYYAKYSVEEGNNNDVKFTFNSTKSKPKGLCFMIVGCEGYNSNENCTIANIPLIESQVYINYMHTENFVYLFEKLSQANKQTGVIPSLNIYTPNEDNVVIKSPDNKSEEVINIDSIPIDEDLRLNGTYIRLDVLFGLKVFQGLSQLVVGSRIELMTINNGRIVKNIYRVRKLEFIDNKGNKVDKYGNILRSRNVTDDDTTSTDSARLLYDNDNDNDRILADVDNSSYIIAVILTYPELGTIHANNVIFSLSKASNGHVTVECSGAGTCNRQTGQCQCYGGYEGEACERMGCQNKCNNHGRCVAFYELFKEQISDDELQNMKNKFGYFGNDANPKFYGCKCEQGYRGPDCSLRECPSDKDPQSATNINTDGEYRDCSGRGICDYTSGICKCHDGYTGAGCEIMLSVM